MIRADAKKNMEKVTAAVLKAPTATQQEIADKVGVSKGTVSNNLNKVKQTGVLKDGWSVRVQQADKNIVELAQGKAVEWLEELREPTSGDVSIANQVARESQKRYSLLAGENTDENGAEKMSEEKKEMIRNLLT